MFRATDEFDKALDKATSHLIMDPDWPSIMKLCDLIRQNDIQPKYALGAIRRKINASNQHSAMYALLVLESVVKNCGAPVHEELASRQFCETLVELVKTTQHEKVREKLLGLIQTWNHAFRKSLKYVALKDAVTALRADGHKFPALIESDAMFSADSAPEWLDGEVCHRCRTSFTLLQRKHHCRACGQVFCGQCSQKTSTIPKYGIEKEVCVCDACYDSISKPSYSSLAQQSQQPKKCTTNEDQLREEEQLLEVFISTLKSQVEIFINRMKSNSSRGRSIANDSSVQTLFMNITAMHSKLLRYIQQHDDSRLHFERLQNKLYQVKDERAAHDALREAERLRQMQIAILRKKKQEYPQHPQQLALQRIQEQEREMQMRQQHQKQEYLMGGYNMGTPGLPAATQQGKVAQQLPKKRTTNEDELREEEELQLALAISQSEAEAKEKVNLRMTNSASPSPPAHWDSVFNKDGNEEAPTDAASRATSPAAPEITPPITAPSTTPPKLCKENGQESSDHDLETFIFTLKSQHSDEVEPERDQPENLQVTDTNANPLSSVPITYATRPEGPFKKAPLTTSTRNTHTSSIDKAVAALEQLSNAHQSNEFTAFGHCVATQLQRLPLAVALQLQTDIQAQITRIRLHQFQESSAAPDAPVSRASNL